MLRQRIAAEGFGTAALVTVVVGSGIMGTNLSDDAGVALLINAISTVAGLAILIWLCAPISGAHFNPVVTLLAVIRQELSVRDGVAYMFIQITGGIGGAITANLMFDLSPITMSTTTRDGVGQWVGEFIATLGLLLVISMLGKHGRPGQAFILVPLWIGSAYFFTSSTSFANPAVTIGRTFTDTFAGIAPESIALFIAAQVVATFVVAATTARNLD